MAYQVLLSDEEYAALAKAATTRGQSVEALVHEAVAEKYLAPAAPAQRAQDPLVEYISHSAVCRKTK
jgi:hypothetical protein